jgi:hypothetical protein
LQAVRCHTTSSEKKALANPMAIYAILSIILIDAISNILVQTTTFYIHKAKNQFRG